MVNPEGFCYLILFFLVIYVTVKLIKRESQHRQERQDPAIGILALAIVVLEGFQLPHQLHQITEHLPGNPAIGQVVMHLAQDHLQLGQLLALPAGNEQAVFQKHPLKQQFQ